jgi:hypothetical protein
MRGGKHILAIGLIAGCTLLTETAARADDFPAPPPDSPEDCASGTAVSAWVTEVQNTAQQLGGTCWLAKGTVLINQVGAAKARYCKTQMPDQADALEQQAQEFDNTASQAQETAGQSCQ